MSEQAVARVILVDDEQMVLSSLSSLITLETGHEALTFVRPADALDYLAAGEPADVIVSDVLMPQMDGLEFLSRARELRPTVPRIILSGYTNAADTAAEFELADVFMKMEKPWDNSQLLDNIERAIRYHQGSHVTHIDGKRTPPLRDIA